MLVSFAFLSSVEIDISIAQEALRQAVIFHVQIQFYHEEHEEKQLTLTP